jgi:Zn-dependent membrane protease YugP
MYWDSYLIFILPAVIFAFLCQFKVHLTFDKYSKIKAEIGLSGAEAARRILDTYGLKHVHIELTGGHLADHFDPSANMLRLSYEVFYGKGIGAIGIAAHETGHAVQYAMNYTPIKLRAGIIPITSVGSRLVTPLIIVGIILEIFLGMGLIFIVLGMLCFALSLILQLITLPVEFDASHRALQFLEDENILFPFEIKGAKKVLNAAAMTYVAALALSLLQLLRLFWIFRGRN